MTDTAAHDQTQTISGIIHYPEHGARAEDPNFAEFEAAKKRLKDAGKYVCVVCGTDQQIELHHGKCEYSLMNAVDVVKFDAEYGLTLTDADFAAFVDSPGNLEPLCLKHHRGSEGIHVMPEPLWGLLRVLKADMTDMFVYKGNI